MFSSTSIPGGIILPLAVFLKSGHFALGKLPFLQFFGSEPLLSIKSAFMHHP